MNTATSPEAKYIMTNDQAEKSPCNAGKVEEKKEGDCMPESTNNNSTRSNAERKRFVESHNLHMGKCIMDVCTHSQHSLTSAMDLLNRFHDESMVILVQTEKRENFAEKTIIDQNQELSSLRLEVQRLKKALEWEFGNQEIKTVRWADGLALVTDVTGRTTGKGCTPLEAIESAMNSREKEKDLGK